MERSDYLRKFTWIKNYLQKLQNEKEISSDLIEKLVYHLSREMSLKIDSVETIEDRLLFYFYEDEQ